MFGWQIISWVGIVVEYFIPFSSDSLTRLIGKPLIPLGAMTLADRAGVKISLWKWIKFIFTVGLPNIMSFISNRPSVVDSRVRMVSYNCLVREFRYLIFLPPPLSVNTTAEREKAV